MPDPYDEEGGVMTAEPPQMAGPPMPPPPQAPQPPPPIGAPAPPSQQPPDRGLFKTQYGDVHVPVQSGGGPSESQMAEIQRYQTDMAKIGQMKQAEADVSAAMRFLGMRGMERDVGSGVPSHIALAKNMQYLSWGHPEHIPTYMRAIQAAQKPAFGPVQGMPVLDPFSHQPVPGLIATPGERGGSVIRAIPKAQAEMSPATERLYLEKNIIYTAAEVEDAKITLLGIKEKSLEWKAQKDKVNELQGELADLKAQHKAKTVKAKSAAAPTAAKPTAASKPGEPPAVTTTEEYQKLPKGTRYHHPNDPPGKYRVKKT